MQNSEAKHLVLHPALRLRRQCNLLHVEGRKRQIELEWILKAHRASTLWCLGGSGGDIQLHSAAYPNVFVLFTARGGWGWGGRRRRAWEEARTCRGRDLFGIEIGRLQHRDNVVVDLLIGGRIVAACDARLPCREDRSLLRRLRNCRVNVECPSKPDDA